MEKLSNHSFAFYNLKHSECYATVQGTFLALVVTGVALASLNSFFAIQGNFSPKLWIIGTSSGAGIFALATIITHIFWKRVSIQPSQKKVTFSEKITYIEPQSITRQDSQRDLLQQTLSSPPPESVQLEPSKNMSAISSLEAERQKQENSPEDELQNFDPEEVRPHLGGVQQEPSEDMSAISSLEAEHQKQGSSSRDEFQDSDSEEARPDLESVQQGPSEDMSAISSLEAEHQKQENSPGDDLQDSDSEEERPHLESVQQGPSEDMSAISSLEAEHQKQENSPGDELQDSAPDEVRPHLESVQQGPSEDMSATPSLEAERQKQGSSSRDELQDSAPDEVRPHLEIASSDTLTTPPDFILDLKGLTLDLEGLNTSMPKKFIEVPFDYHGYYPIWSPSTKDRDSITEKTDKKQFPHWGIHTSESFQPRSLNRKNPICLPTGVITALRAHIRKYPPYRKFQQNCSAETANSLLFPTIDPANSTVIQQIDRDYVYVHTLGDGNCFYYSAMTARLYHLTALALKAPDEALRITNQWLEQLSKSKWKISPVTRKLKDLIAHPSPDALYQFLSDGNLVQKLTLAMREINYANYMYQPEDEPEGAPENQTSFDLGLPALEKSQGIKNSLFISPYLENTAALSNIRNDGLYMRENSDPQNSEAILFFTGPNQAKGDHYDVLIPKHIIQELAAAQKRILETSSAK